MRHIAVAIIALLVLSGCHTSGYNPLKIAAPEGWKIPAGLNQHLN